MKVITRHTLAASAAARWAYQYKHPNHRNPDTVLKAEKLAALGMNPDPDEVDRIIGNTSWTTTKCDQCKATNMPVVEVGEERDYESDTALLCLSCLNGAVAMLSATAASPPA